VHTGTTHLERAAPFFIGIFILIVSVVTTHEVIERVEDELEGGRTKAELDKIKPDLAPSTYALSLPWVADVAQIPALLGTPLSGLFLVNHANFIILYTAVLAAGLLVYFYFLRMVPINDYRKWGKKVLKYRVSLLVMGGLVLNAVCGVLTYFTVT
jgi:hypothetical protein